MRSIPAPLKTVAQSAVFPRADLVKIVLADGTIYRLTGHDRAINIAFDGDPANDFTPHEFGGLRAYSAKINTAIDESELHILIDGATFTRDDIRRDRFAAAVVKIGYCDWSDTGNGSYVDRIYDAGNARLDDGFIVLELRGPERRLEFATTVVLTVNCRHKLGDPDCRVEIDAPFWEGITTDGTDATDAPLYVADPDSKSDDESSIVKPSVQNGFWYKAIAGGTPDIDEPVWPTVLGGQVADGEVVWEAIHARRLNGTVDSVVNNRSFTATGILVADDWWAQGEVVWLTGLNAGFKGRVRQDESAGSSGIVSLYSFAFNAIQVGDTFEIVAGCRKRLTEDCAAKFDNAWNHGAFPYLVDENATFKAARG